MEENNYYPFGLRHRNYNMTKLDYDENGMFVDVPVTAVSVYKYKYQGQERQDELGLNWDSFKWRNYDYAIGRFMSIDPLSEKYPYNGVYNFSENKVVDGRELEGLEWVDSKNNVVYNPKANSGKGDFTSYATSDHRNLAKSVNQTATGRGQFQKLVNSTTKIETNLDNKSKPGRKGGELTMATTVPIGVMERRDGDGVAGEVQTEKVVITFFTLNIDAIEGDLKNGINRTIYGKPIGKNFNFSDLIGIAFGHEIEHTTDENILTEANKGNVEKVPTEKSGKIINETTELKTP